MPYRWRYHRPSSSPPVPPVRGAAPLFESPFHGNRRFLVRPHPGRLPAGRRRRGRAPLQAAGPGLGARLPGRRPGHRPLRSGPGHRLARHHPHCRIRGGDVPVRHRAGDEALAPVGPASADLRPGQPAGRHQRHPAHHRRHPVRGAVGSVLHLRLRLRAHLHRHRHAGAGGTAGTGLTAWPAHRFHPAVRGPADRPAAGHRRVPRACHTRECRACHTAVADHRHCPAQSGRPGGRRPLGAQPPVPRAGRQPCPGGHDRGRTAGGAGCRPADGNGRPVHGHGRLRGRRAAVRIELPPPAGSRHRAVPRAAAGALLPGRGHVAGPEGGGRELGHHRLGRHRADGGQGPVRLWCGPAGPQQPHRRDGPGAIDGPGRRIRLRALFRGRQCRRHRRHRQRQHDGHHRAVDGHHAAHPHPAPALRCKACRYTRGRHLRRTASDPGGGHGALWPDRPSTACCR